MSDTDLVHKIVIVGDSRAGKSSILRRLADGTFDSNYSPTIGVDFGNRDLRIGNAVARLQIYDTSGQECFQTIMRPYHRGAEAVMFVYDVTSRESFHHLDDWLKEISENTESPESPLRMILGSKCDADASQVEVPTQEGAAYAQSVGAAFMEVSASSGIGIDAAFALLAEDLLHVNANVKVWRPGGVRLPQPADPVPCATARSSASRCCVS